MGLTFLKVAVGNPSNPDVTETVDFLVDSGAIYSVVPTPILEKLGIKPIAQHEFILANGATIVRKKGTALYKYEERIGGAELSLGKRMTVLSWES